MKLYLASILTVFIIFASGQAQAFVIGEVIKAKADLYVERDSKKMTLSVGDKVEKDDVLKTSTSGRARIQFIDGTLLTLGFNTEAHLDEFVYSTEKPTTSKLIFNFVKGAFYYVSGKVSKAAPKNTKLKTEFATIGIRGTKVWGGQGMVGYGVFVEEGAVEISNALGNTYLPEGLGVHVPSKDDAPSIAHTWSAKGIKNLQAQILFEDEM